MLTSPLVAVASLFATQASAHYVFGHLIVNGTQSGLFQYIRDVTANETYLESWDYGRVTPHYGRDLESTNFTCGRDAHKFAPKTSTATVLAGSALGMRVAPQRNNTLTGSYNNTIFHAGPANIYMAKVPDGVKVENWHGSDGKWFKIAQFGAIDKTNWVIDRQPSINFTLPLSTPPGTYLLRIEQFAFFSYTQFFMNCAHINVIGPGGGTPGPFAKFPGEYDYDDLVARAKSGGWNADYTKFLGIGPAVWKG